MLDKETCKQLLKIQEFKAYQRYLREELLQALNQQVWGLKNPNEEYFQLQGKKAMLEEILEVCEIIIANSEERKPPYARSEEKRTT